MTKVITQTEIMKYSGMSMAEFPLGTILTPAAKDWAAEHGLEISIGGSAVAERTGSKALRTEGNEKSELLKLVIKTVLNNTDKTGGIFTKDELVKTVTACLTKLGCSVEQ